jgi:hypothetical protein
MAHNSASKNSGRFQQRFLVSAFEMLSMVARLGLESLRWLHLHCWGLGAAFLPELLDIPWSGISPFI